MHARVVELLLLLLLFCYCYCYLLLISSGIDLYKGGLQRSQFLPFIDTLKDRTDIVNLNSGVDYRLKGAYGACAVRTSFLWLFASGTVKDGVYFTYDFVHSLASPMQFAPFSQLG